MAGELNISDSNFASELLGLPAPLAFIDFETFLPANYVIPGTMIGDIIGCQWSCHTLMAPGLEWQGRLRHDEFLWTGDIGWNPIYAFVQTLYEATASASTILIYSPHELRTFNTCKQLARNDIDRYNNGELDPGYVVVDGHGNKVPLMSIAPMIEGWCDSMAARVYDMNPQNNSAGVPKWIHSPVIGTSNSIKDVFPAAMAEYSRSAELLASQGEPADGYAGLRSMGGIAKGDECTAQYLAALDRPPRAGVDIHEPGNAPFDSGIASQCLIYCKLDTLSMVIIYLAVLEATDRWNDVVSGKYAEYAKLSDGLYHAILTDGDNQVFYKTCDAYRQEPMPYSTPIEFVTERTFQNQPIYDMYSSLCPICRKLRNEAN